LFNLNLKYLIIFLASFIPIELPLTFLLSSKAEDINNIHFQIEKSEIYDQDSKNTKKKIFQNINTEFGNDLKEDIYKFGNDLIYLIALDENLSKKDFVLDIESDIQYEKDNIYYAEGNAVLFFSNAEIKGDKVTYDKTNKTIIIEGNVIFIKGDQYFESSKILYNLKNGEGFIDNIYGVLDFNNFINDFEFKNIEDKKENNIMKVSDLKYIDSIKLGLVNDFQEAKKFNLTNISFDIPSIKKWRYKSRKIFLKDKILESEKIIFTNDVFNKPQFILQSKNFTGEIIDNKIKLISKKSHLIFDDRLKIPIGKRTIYDDESKASWGLGSDYKEKDGFYIYRNFNKLKLNDNFNLEFKPYFLIQRAAQGTSKTFREKNNSILTNKVTNNINISDIFALDSQLRGNINSINLNWESSLNSFNFSRFHEAARSKLSLQKTIDLSSSKSEFDNKLNSFIVNNKEIDFSNNREIEVNNFQDNIIKNSDKKYFSNFLDIKFNTSYREKVSRGYDGESEIYFGNAISLANRKSWKKNDNYTNLFLIYDFGIFKAERKNIKKFAHLNRNLFAFKLANKYKLWEKSKVKKNIDEEYKYTPFVINEGISWISNIQSGIFLYSDGSSQNSISLSSGPEIILGEHKNRFLDYTKINLNGIYVIKNGESPFKFDDINENFRINIKLNQQIYGPLLFSYETSYDIEDGEYSLPRYRININRRAYSLGAFYNKSNESIGLSFNIFNFNYKGFPKKF